jgi:hypothetical protein
VLTEMGSVLTTKAFVGRVPTEMEECANGDGERDNDESFCGESANGDGERANHASFCGERANGDGERANDAS